MLPKLIPTGNIGIGWTYLGGCLRSRSVRAFSLCFSTTQCLRPLATALCKSCQSQCQLTIIVQQFKFHALNYYGKTTAGNGFESFRGCLFCVRGLLRSRRRWNQFLWQVSTKASSWRNELSCHFFFTIPVLILGWATPRRQLQISGWLHRVPPRKWKETNR